MFICDLFERGYHRFDGSTGEERKVRLPAIAKDMKLGFGGVVARNYDWGNDNATVTEHPKDDRFGSGQVVNGGKEINIVESWR